MLKLVLLIAFIILILYLKNIYSEHFDQYTVSNNDKTFDDSVTKTEYRTFYNVVPGSKDEKKTETIPRKYYFDKYYENNNLNNIINNDKINYLEHIDIGLKKNKDNTYPVINPSNLTNLKDKVRFLNYRNFKYHNIIDINNQSLDKLTNDLKSKIEENNLIQSGDPKYFPDEVLVESPNSDFINIGGKYGFNTIRDYHRYQLLKKKDNDLKYEKHNINFLDENASDKTLQELYNELKKNDSDETGMKAKLKDLYGDPHPVQKRTYSNLVSRGMGKVVNGRDNVYDPREENKLKPIIVKSCPIPFNKTYTVGEIMNMKQEDINKMDERIKKRYNKKYYKDIGGTKRVEKKNKCEECNYPLGCISSHRSEPYYEYKDENHKGCIKGQNRVCLPCDTCPTGEYYIKTLCGEGGGSVNTECARCTPCKEGTYKVAGCDNKYSVFDNVCVEMTKCKGKPTSKDTYKDPGRGNRYFTFKEGVTGSNNALTENQLKELKMKSSDIEKYPSKESVSKSKETKDKYYQTEVEVGENVTEKKMVKGKLVVDKKPRKKVKVLRPRDREGKPIKSPYFGKDRECKKCDVCPTGFKHIRGCMGLNSKSNTVCQRQIDIEEYINKNVVTSGKENTFLNRSKLREKLKSVNDNLLSHDELLRSRFFVLRDDEYVDVTPEGKKHNLTLSDVNSLKIFTILNISNDIKDYLEKPTTLKYRKQGKKPKSNNEPFISSIGTDFIPVIPDNLLTEFATDKCITYTDEELKQKNLYIDKNNEGCYADTNRKYVKKREKCNTNEKMISLGDKYTDIKCGICSCPMNYIGENPICSGTTDDLKENNYRGIKGCRTNVKCDKHNNKGTLLKTQSKDCLGKECIYFSKPDEYGDKVKTNICKKCRDKCPPGTFKIQDCIPGTNSDLICKPHRECDVKTMIRVRDGTNDKDTICECIDGYTWPVDKITGEENVNANKCVKKKGECWKNPCHKEAVCYDNFDSNGKLSNPPFNCICNSNKGYVETEDLGIGINGCLLLPKRHTHNTDLSNIPSKYAPMMSNPDYSNINRKQYSIKNHIDSDFHQNVNHSHIHKEKIYSPISS